MTQPINFDALLKGEVEAALAAAFPTLEEEQLAVFLYNLPPDLPDVVCAAVIIPLVGSVDAPTKRVTVQVRTRHSSGPPALIGISAIYHALKDREFQPGASLVDYKTVCVALSTPSYIGLDDAGRSLYEALFELTSVY
jgi:hypothetical protein